MNDQSRPPIQPAPDADFGGHLVRSAKSVDAPPSNPPSKAQQNRAQLFRYQRVAASILKQQRVAHCLWSMADLATQVQVKRRHGSARFTGLQTCGSVWHCPCCSARISEVRRVELNDALAQARVLGLRVALITLTARHSASDPLPELLDALKKAKRHWHDSRTYKGFKDAIRGTITATELTHGKNGWHPHFHVLMFYRSFGDPIRTLSVEPTLRDQWLASLKACGLDGNGAAFRLDDADAAGNYVAKWGAAEEMTLTAKKGGPDGGKTKGRHPFDFLRTAAVSPADRALFFTYATAFKGRRQLQWTPGLRTLLAVPHVPDPQAAVIEDSNEDEWLASIAPSDWSGVRVKGRGVILDRCEEAKDLESLQPALDAIMEGPDIES